MSRRILKFIPDSMFTAVITATAYRTMLFARSITLETNLEHPAFYVAWEIYAYVISILLGSIAWEVTKELRATFAHDSAKLQGHSNPTNPA